MSTIELKVAEAMQDDINRGVVRVDEQFLEKINAKPGDYVSITGEREGIAIVDRAYAKDVGLDIIRMDGLLRKNAKTTVGDIVKVEKISSLQEAKKVVVAPVTNVALEGNLDVLKKAFVKKGVIKGDIIGIGGFSRQRKARINTNNPFINDLFTLLNDDFFGFNLHNLRFKVVQTVPAGPVVISENTQLEIDARVLSEDENVAGITYEDIGGLKSQLHKVRELVELPLRHPEIFKKLGIEVPKGVLLFGPPGTGKTLLARAIANETEAKFYSINAPEIVNKYYGESERKLREIFEEASNNAPSIIFIDELDAIAVKREEVQGDTEKRIVAQLLTLMDGLNSDKRVIVIAATNRIDSLDEALRRPGRFDRELEIGVPKQEDRLEILKIHTRGMPLDKSVQLNKIAQVTHGFVGADVAALVKEAAFNVLRRTFKDMIFQKEKQEISEEIINNLKLFQEDFSEALKSVRPSAMREFLLEKPKIKWTDVGGLEGTKKQLQEMIEWPLKNPEIFKNVGVRPPKGVLLYGPPGTGKTMLAKAVASETECNFIYVKGPEVVSKWVGESEKAVRKIFQKARQNSPTIIFFDEFDAIAGARTGGEQGKVNDKLVNQLLTEIDGLEELINVKVIAATNRPNLIDAALLRPGRFDKLMYIGGPDADSRKKILHVCMEGMPVEKKEALIKELVKSTEGYVGADLDALCREAGLIALRKNKKAKKVTKEDFVEALTVILPSVTPEVMQMYKELEKHFKNPLKKADRVSAGYVG